MWMCFADSHTLFFCVFFGGRGGELIEWLSTRSYLEKCSLFCRLSFCFLSFFVNRQNERKKKQTPQKKVWWWRRMSGMTFPSTVVSLSVQSKCIHISFILKDERDKTRRDGSRWTDILFNYLCMCVIVIFIRLFVFITETDARFRLTEDLVDSEREFLVSLRTIYDIYARPLRKLCSISDEEQKQLFGGIEPILSVSNMLLTKVKITTTFFENKWNKKQSRKWGHF